MTPNVFGWVESLHLSGRTLDIGSYDVNGCVRRLFDDYVGLDMRRGPNVDVVANSHRLPFPTALFDNVLNLECLEHDDQFWWTVPEMRRVAKPGGRLIISTRGIGFPKHDFPADYWRFTREALLRLLDGLEEVYAFEVPVEDGVFASARLPALAGTWTGR